MKRDEWVSADSIPIPQIYSIGYSKDPGITRYGPAVRQQYIIHYVLSGKGIFNGVSLTEGEGFLISPGVLEEYYPDKDEPWSFLWVISEDRAMQYFFNCHGAEDDTGIFHFHNSHVIREVADEITEDSGRIATSAQLSEKFLRIFNGCIEHEPPQGSSAKIYFEASVNYVKATLHLPISVERLCRLAGITQPYLYRIFKQETGLSPKQYISEQRLTRAKELLQAGKLSISQIANSVGFQSVLDFSKFFSKQTGASPSVYRSLCRSSEKA